MDPVSYRKDLTDQENKSNKLQLQNTLKTDCWQQKSCNSII